MLVGEEVEFATPVMKEAAALVVRLDDSVSSVDALEAVESLELLGRIVVEVDKVVRADDVAEPVEEPVDEAQGDKPETVNWGL